MSYENELFAQAELRIVRGSTNERKKMSTKTTFKRISLVAVASLGFGVLSVVPSNAALSALVDEVGIITAFADSSAIPVTVGAATAVVVPVRVGGAAALTAAKGFTVTTAVQYKPTGAASPTIAAAVTGFAAPFVAVATTTINTSQVEASGAVLQTLANATSGGTLAATSAGVGTVIGQVTLTGFDKPGAYTFTVTPDGAATDVAAIVTVYAGYSADLVNVNKAFPYQGAGFTSSWTGTAGGQASVRFVGLASTTKYYITSSSGAIVSVTNSDATRNGTIYNTNGTNLANGVYATTGTVRVTDSFDVSVTDLGAASTTVTVKTFDVTTGAATTFAAALVTWGAAPVLSATNSTSLIDSTTLSTFGLGTVDEVLSVDGTVALTRKATIKVTLKDSALNVSAATILTAVVSGPGLIQGKTGTGSTLNAYTDGSASGSRVATVTTDTLGQGFFAVFSDGSGGVGTITISAGTTVISTETITFSGIATQLKDNNVDADLESVNKVNIGIAETGKLHVGSYDANGNVVSANPTGLVVTSDSTTVATVAITGGTGDITVTGVAAGKTNITISVGALATATIKLVIPVTITKTTAKTVKMTFDKATYAPGELMTLTVSALDSNGSAVADGSRVLFSDTVTANVLLGTLPAGTITLVGGKATYTYYAPFAAGSIVLTGVEGAAVDAVIASTTAAPYTAVKVIASAAVVNAQSDAAAAAAEEATAAANDATDAALSAAEAAEAATAMAQEAVDAVAELSASVTKLISALRAQITTLTNLVVKIQKKVKA